jgi:polygalacturonase
MFGGSKLGLWISVAAVICSCRPVSAQDTRTVLEPRVPPVCITLSAQLASRGHAIAESDDTRLDTLRLQQASDRCPAGMAVELRSHRNYDAFLSGPLELRRGVTLLIDADTTLYGSRDPRLYDVSHGSCGVVSSTGAGCKPLIHAGAANEAIMGDGAIDGRGGSKLLGLNTSWWDLAQQAKVQGANQNCPRLIVADHADNFILYRITLRDSPNFHVFVRDTNGFTAWGVKIDTPATARNTDGIDPSSSSNVSIVHCYIHAGDDNVAIKAGKDGPSTHITVADDHFYTGHGMSIGSDTAGGVSYILIQDLSIDGADNGLRIKSNSERGGLVQGVRYTDVCMRDVKNLIVMETTYEGHTDGMFPPRFENILFQNVRATGRGKISIAGLNDANSLDLSLDGVVLSGVAPSNIHFAHARVTLGPGTVNFIIPSENDVRVLHVAGDRAVSSCSGRFAEFPATGSDASADPPSDVQSAPPVARPIIVAADGSGDYKSVQQAVDAVPQTGGTIRIRPGIYREIVTISKNHMRMIGDVRHPSRVVLVNDRSNHSAGGTFRSYSVGITGDDFYAAGITFQNDFATRHPSEREGMQAVALSVRGDRAVFRHVRVLGEQDSLLAQSKSCVSEQGPCVTTRQLFSDCYVEGTVDFIFGDAKTVFQHCEIHGLPHSTVFLTAQSRHYPEEDSGYVFDHCIVTASSGIGKLYLGRPWRPYSTVIFLHCKLDAPIRPDGWSEWHPGETHSLETATYAEFHSTGRGADIGKREARSMQLTAREAKKYSPRVFLAGADHWHPEAAR